MKSEMQHQPERADRDTFDFEVDHRLKVAFETASAIENQRADQVLRDFMQAYVEQRRERILAAEAARQSRLIAADAADPASEESDVIRWIERTMDLDGWTE